MKDHPRVNESDINSKINHNAENHASSHGENNYNYNSMEEETEEKEAEYHDGSKRLEGRKPARKRVEFNFENETTQYNRKSNVDLREVEQHMQHAEDGTERKYYIQPRKHFGSFPAIEKYVVPSPRANVGESSYGRLVGTNFLCSEVLAWDGRPLHDTHGRESNGQLKVSFLADSLSLDDTQMDEMIFDSDRDWEDDTRAENSATLDGMSTFDDMEHTTVAGYTSRSDWWDGCVTGRDDAGAQGDTVVSEAGDSCRTLNVSTESQEGMSNVIEKKAALDQSVQVGTDPIGPDRLAYDKYTKTEVDRFSPLGESSLPADVSLSIRGADVPPSLQDFIQSGGSDNPSATSCLKSKKHEQRVVINSMKFTPSSESDYGTFFLSRMLPRNFDVRFIQQGFSSHAKLHTTGSFKVKSDIAIDNSQTRGTVVELLSRKSGTTPVAGAALPPWEQQLQQQRVSCRTQEQHTPTTSSDTLEVTVLSNSVNVTLDCASRNRSRLSSVRFSRRGKEHEKVCHSKTRGDCLDSHSPVRSIGPTATEGFGETSENKFFPEQGVIHDLLRPNSFLPRALDTSVFNVSSHKLKPSETPPMPSPFRDISREFPISCDLKGQPQKVSYASLLSLHPSLISGLSSYYDMCSKESLMCESTSAQCDFSSYFSVSTRTDDEADICLAQDVPDNAEGAHEDQGFGNELAQHVPDNAEGAHEDQGFGNELGVSRYLGVLKDQSAGNTFGVGNDLSVGNNLTVSYDPLSTSAQIGSYAFDQTSASLTRDRHLQPSGGSQQQPSDEPISGSLTARFNTKTDKPAYYQDSSLSRSKLYDEFVSASAQAESGSSFVTVISASVQKMMEKNQLPENMSPARKSRSTERVKGLNLLNLLKENRKGVKNEIIEKMHDLIQEDKKEAMKMKTFGRKAAQAKRDLPDISSENESRIAPGNSLHGSSRETPATDTPHTGVVANEIKQSKGGTVHDSLKYTAGHEQTSKISKEQQELLKGNAGKKDEARSGEVDGGKTKITTVQDRKSILLDDYDDRSKASSGYEDKSKISFGYNEKPKISAQLKERAKVMTGYDDKTISSGYDDKSKISAGYDDKSKTSAGYDDKSKISAGYDDKSKRSAGYAEISNTAPGLEDKSRICAVEDKSMISAVQDKSKISAGYDDKSKISAGYDDKSKISAGYDDKSKISAGYEDKLKISAGYDDKSKISAGYAEKGLEDKSRISAVEDRSRISAVEDKSRISAVEDKSRIGAFENKSRVRAVEDKSRISSVEDKSRISALQDKSRKSAGYDDKSKISAVYDDKSKIDAKYDDKSKISSGYDDKSKISAGYDDKSKISAGYDEKSKISAGYDDKSKISAGYAEKGLEDKSRINTVEDKSRISAIEAKSKISAVEDTSRISAGHEDKSRISALEDKSRISAVEDTSRISAVEDKSRISAGYDDKSKINTQYNKAMLSACREDKSRISSGQEDKSRFRASLDETSRIRLAQYDKSKISTGSDDKSKVGVGLGQLSKPIAGFDEHSNISADEMKSLETDKAGINEGFKDVSEINTVKRDKTRSGVVHEHQTMNSSYKLDQDNISERYEGIHLIAMKGVLRAKVSEVKEDKSRIGAKEEEKSQTRPKDKEKSQIRPNEEEKSQIWPKEEEKSQRPKEEGKSKIRPKEEEKSQIRPKEDEKSQIRPNEEEKSRIRPKEEEKSQIRPKEDEKSHIGPKEEEKSQIRAKKEDKLIVGVKEDGVLKNLTLKEHTPSIDVKEYEAADIENKSKMESVKQQRPVVRVDDEHRLKSKSVEVTRANVESEGQSMKAEVQSMEAEGRSTTAEGQSMKAVHGGTPKARPEQEDSPEFTDSLKIPDRYDDESKISEVKPGRYAVKGDTLREEIVGEESVESTEKTAAGHLDALHDDARDPQSFREETGRKTPRENREVGKLKRVSVSGQRISVSGQRLSVSGKRLLPQNDVADTEMSVPGGENTDRPRGVSRDENDGAPSDVTYAKKSVVQRADLLVRREGRSINGQGQDGWMSGARTKRIMDFLQKRKDERQSDAMLSKRLSLISQQRAVSVGEETSAALEAFKARHESRRKAQNGGSFDGETNEQKGRSYGEKTNEQKGRSYGEKTNEQKGRSYGEKTNEQKGRSYGEKTNEQKGRSYVEKTNEPKELSQGSSAQTTRAGGDIPKDHRKASDVMAYGLRSGSPPKRKESVQKSMGGRNPDQASVSRDGRSGGRGGVPRRACSRLPSTQRGAYSTKRGTSSTKRGVSSTQRDASCEEKMVTRVGSEGTDFPKNRNTICKLDRKTLPQSKLLVESHYYPRTNLVSVVVKPINIEVNRENMNLQVHIDRKPPRSASRGPLKRKISFIRRPDVNAISAYHLNKDIIDTRAANPPFNTATRLEADHRYQSVTRYWKIR